MTNAYPHLLAPIKIGKFVLKNRMQSSNSHDYTLYLQPNLYTVKAGHKLALVIYTYEMGKANYSQNYQITLENSSVNAVIPVNEAVEEPEVKNPFTDVAESDFFYNAADQRSPCRTGAGGRKGQSLPGLPQHYEHLLLLSQRQPSQRIYGTLGQAGRLHPGNALGYLRRL